MAPHRSIANVASTSAHSAPAPLRLEPPTPQQEADDFKRACDEVQTWWDSPRFKGIKVRVGASLSVCETVDVEEIELITAYRHHLS